MSKFIFHVVGVGVMLSASLALATDPQNTLSGKVISFDANKVRLEVDGHLMEFARVRVVDQKNLKAGEIAVINLDTKTADLKASKK